MRCGKPANVTMVLIGLHEIGLVGLKDALELAENSGLSDREAILDLILRRLAEQNYIPEVQTDAYRRAVWREILRQRREDFSEYYSEVEVVVRGTAGAEREAFVELVVSVFGDFELKPCITFEEGGNDASPELLLGSEPIAQGPVTREHLRAVVRRRISEW